MKVLAIANNTFKEAYRQPIYLILLSLSAVLILLSYWFTLFGFGEEVKMIKDMGFATITLCGLLIALFTCSSVIADEIEKRTVLTILCKPVTRITFLVGKFLGIIIAVLVASIVLTIVLLIPLFCMYYNKQFDKWTISKVLSAARSWTLYKWILLAVFFSYLQVVVLTAISVAVSTRFPMIINVTICMAIFVVGHLSTYLYVFLERKGHITKLVGHYIYLFLPNLENFNVTSPIALGTYPSLGYCLLSTLYALIYIVASITLAALLFRDREVM